MDQPQAPPKKPVLTKIDPEKFLGGPSIEKLKTMLKDVEEFASIVKTKSAGLGVTLDLLHDTVVKFSSIVERMDRIVGSMEDKNGKVSGRD